MQGNSRWQRPSPRLVGIDPGLAALGICVLNGQEVEAKKLITTSKQDGSEAQRVQDIAGKVYLFIEDLGEEIGGENTIVAIEAQHFERVKGQHEQALKEQAAKAAKTLRVALVTGAVIEVAAQFGLSVVMVTPSQAKRALTGNGQASKEQVQGMAARMAGVEPKEISEHEADAVAVAAGAQNILTDRKLEELAQDA